MPDPEKYKDAIDAIDAIDEIDKIDEIKNYISYMPLELKKKLEEDNITL